MSIVKAKYHNEESGYDILKITGYSFNSSDETYIITCTLTNPSGTTIDYAEKNKLYISATRRQRAGSDSFKCNGSRNEHFTRKLYYQGFARDEEADIKITSLVQSGVNTFTLTVREANNANWVNYLSHYLHDFDYSQNPNLYTYVKICLCCDCGCSKRVYKTSKIYKLEREYY